LTNGKEINWSILKIKGLLMHKEVNIKINGMLNKCFIY